MSPILLWSLVLGLTGFVCGFFGPIVLNPWANQGPLAGLLITGPGGAILGAVLGALVAAFGMRPAVARRLLTAIAAVGGLAILFFTLPEPEYRATVLDLEVRECAAAQTWHDRAVGQWEKRLEVNANLWGVPPANWRQTFADRAATGGVLTIGVRRHRDVVASRRYWNFGAIDATAWTTARSRRMMRREHVYVREGCAAYRPGATGTFLASAAPEEDRYPPADPARFLDMHVLEPVPSEYRTFAH